MYLGKTANDDEYSIKYELVTTQDMPTHSVGAAQVEGDRHKQTGFV